MGFCLFEDADNPRLFMAVNSNCVEAVEAMDRSDETPKSRISFTNGNDQRENQPRYCDVFGHVQDIEGVLQETSKIGLEKSKLHIMSKLSAAPTPLLINNPNRIYLVREIVPEELFSKSASYLTASTLYYITENNRFISERPGRFVELTNAGGKTPLLDYREQKKT